jgi:hypothetical protein
MRGKLDQVERLVPEGLLVDTVLAFRSWLFNYR